MSVFSKLIEPKVLRILKLLVAKRGSFFHLQSISTEAKVPIASTFRIMNRLVRIGVVEIIQINKMKIYKLAESKDTKEIIAVLGGKK